MNDANDIAAQALRALQLRRQVEQGELTHEEYLNRLNALQSGYPEPALPAPAATPKSPLENPVTPQSTSPEPRTVMSALEVLHLRRRLDNGALTQQEYQTQLHAGLQDHLTTARPASNDTTAPRTTDPTPEASGTLADQVFPARYMAMKCPVCEGELRIYDQTFELQCSDCDADVLVERKNCTISLRRLEEGILPVAEPRSSNVEELSKLQGETVMLINVKRVAGILGLVSAAVSAYACMADMDAQRTAMATNVLFCGSALLGMVVCITRHTSKVRVQLAMRIRALSLSEE